MLKTIDKTKEEYILTNDEFKRAEAELNRADARELETRRAYVEHPNNLNNLRRYNKAQRERMKASDAYVKTIDKLCEQYDRDNQNI